MLETAKKEGYAYPAVNVTTIEVINGALRAFSEAKSDGIIQVSIGGGKFASGTSVGSSAIGAIVLAEATRRLAEEHKVLVGLHTDHCPNTWIPSCAPSWPNPAAAWNGVKLPFSTPTCWMPPPCPWPKTSSFPKNC